MNLKKVFGVIGRIVFTFLLGSIIVSANMLIKNSDNIKMVNNEDKIKKEKVKMDDDTLLGNEQMCTSTEIDTSESTSIRVHPVTGEKKEINSIEEVDSILDQIRSMTVISCEKGNVQGYSYFLALYRNEDFVQSVYVSSESIQTDGMRYAVESTKDLSDNIVD